MLWVITSRIKPPITLLDIKKGGKIALRPYIQQHKIKYVIFKIYNIQIYKTRFIVFLIKPFYIFILFLLLPLICSYFDFDFYFKTKNKKINFPLLPWRKRAKKEHHLKSKRKAREAIVLNKN
jgi:hypothetical protein